MARVKIGKSVCCKYEEKLFYCSQKNATLNISIEELEALRLIDIEMQHQVVVAKHMNISRSTLQRLLISAHQKLAYSLVNSLNIKVGGGCYVVNDKCPNECLKCQACMKDKR